MKMRLFCAVFLVCLAGGVFAEEAAPASKGALFVGIGPEVAAHTRKGAAVGVGLAAGYELNPQMAVGVKTAFFHNLDTISTFEPLAFFRYYLPIMPGTFVQAEAGTVVYFENGGSYPAVSGGLSVGWRFDFPNYHIEPAVRFGYPHMWGAGIMVGYKF